jgi:histidyl-tRNA synthetase
MPKEQIKTPKGTRDWAGDDIALREEVFNKIRKVFKLHNGNEIDTPAFELKSILTDKYGEDARLIYHLQDQGGEVCALRYDLTVPFARWLAMSNLRQMKRFQIGKVYRRDQPAPESGRMREFYQCDFDFAGSFETMIPDAEILCITAEVFEALGIDVTIRINHRSVLDGIFRAVGVPENLVRSISSAVDKLDKLSWADVKKEVEQKGLEAEVANNLGKYVLEKEGDHGFAATLKILQIDDLLSKNEDILKGVNEMKLLLRYLNSYDIAKCVKFDLSLARGLDYYTGLIYEVVPVGISQKVGSIAAGGRYDNLVSTFSKKEIPCVGISFGVDRILTILKSTARERKKPSKVAVWIVAYGIGPVVEEKMAIARQLRKAGISVDFDQKSDRKPRKQIELAESDGAVAAVIIEDDGSMLSGAVQFRVLSLPTKSSDNEVVVKREGVLEEVKKRLSLTEGC